MVAYGTVLLMMLLLRRRCDYDFQAAQRSLSYTSANIGR